MIYKDENDVDYRKEILNKFFNDHISFLKKKLVLKWSSLLPFENWTPLVQTIPIPNTLSWVI